MDVRSGRCSILLRRLLQLLMDCSASCALLSQARRYGECAAAGRRPGRPVIWVGWLLIPPSRAMECRTMTELTNKEKTPGQLDEDAMQAGQSR